MPALDSESIAESVPESSAQTSLEWQKVLSLLQQFSARALQLQSFLLFELDEGSAGSPLLVLRATTDDLPLQHRVRLDEAALSFLRKVAEEPFSLDILHPPSELQPLALFIPADRFASILVAAVKHDRCVWGYLVGCSTQPHTFTPLERTFFSLFASYVAVAVKNVRLRAETASSLSEAMSLQTISSALVEERSLDAILAVIIDEAIRLLQARNALVLLLEAGGERFRVCAREGSGLPGLTSGLLSVQDSLNGLVVTTGQPLVSNDVLTDPRANHARAVHLGVRTVAIAPLKIRNKTIGTIALHNKRDGYFSQADVEILCSFANQAAIAIDNARLFGELLRARDEIQRKAQELQKLFVQTMSILEDERQRIAADMHDEVISHIVGALYEVETCMQLRQDSKDLHQHFLLLKQLLNGAVENTRTSIYNLWPATLDHMGLIPALRELFSQQERSSGIHHSLHIVGPDNDLEPNARIAVYRIVQEALNNVYHHAGATSVDTVIRFGPRRARIVVQDNGDGFDVDAVSRAPLGQHLGLIVMRERALSIGGNLRVVSQPGKGSQVVLEVPVRDGHIHEEDRRRDHRDSNSRDDC